MSVTPANRPSELDRAAHKSWTDLGVDFWSYLTGRGATINYTFVDMAVEVPQDTGAGAAHAIWTLNGTVSVASGSDEVQTLTMLGLSIRSDLQFVIELPPVGKTTARRIRGTLVGEGGVLDLVLDELPALDRKSGGAALRKLARQVSAAGLKVTIRDGSRLLATVGAVRPNLFGLLLAQSRYVRLGPLRTVARSLQRRGRPTLALSELLPPATVMPIIPTLRRQSRRVTTTHDPDGGGRPRFYFSGQLNRLPGSRTREFFLRVGQVTTIGSDPSCHLQLDGLEPFEAEVRRDEWDEYWVVSTGTTPVRVNGAPVTSARMRTGTKVQIGRWIMSYFRAEHADHGRPHGGRIGGEAGHQIPQDMPVYRQPRSRS